VSGKLQAKSDVSKDYMNNTDHFHFIGIGGIGMSSIAKIMRLQGYTISGCDTNVAQRTIKELISLGCIITQGHNQALCHDTSITTVVHSSAIQKNNPELIAAQTRNIPIVHRSIMLSKIMSAGKSIGVTGAHGKTTTTAMIGHILSHAAYNPTILVGGHINAWSSNAHYAQNDYIVAEVDESDRSFLNIKPTIALVTNIDVEHLETYKDFDDIQTTFSTFLYGLPQNSVRIIGGDDIHLQNICTHIPHISFGMHEQNDIRGTDIKLSSTGSNCTVYDSRIQKTIGTLLLPVPGIHNILNALGAITAALEIGIPFNIIATALHTFESVDRRFTYKGLTATKADVFDDYAHHPNEIKHTLTIARARSKQKLIVIWQPHRYIRTASLWDQFIQMFKASDLKTGDILIITDIYPGPNEIPLPHIRAQDFAKTLQDTRPSFTVLYIPWDSSFTSLQTLSESLSCPGDTIITLGAGSITNFAHHLVTYYQN